MPNDNPNYTPQDLTAYALGELDPTSDAHRAIAAALKQDPAIAAEIDGIKHSAATVRDALANEPVPALTSRDREGAGLVSVADRAGAPLPDGRGSLIAMTGRPRAPLFARPALLAAGFALAAGAAIAVVNLVQPTPGTPSQHAGPHADAPRGLAAIHAALQTPITASFQDAPLTEVFAAVQRETHADLAVDWPALEARGIARDTKVTFDADALPARDLLSLALAACWQQLPHPDPAVWTVTTTQLRIEPRSAVVQRTLDHAHVALASANATNANMTQSQLALADHPGWQQPELVTAVVEFEREEAQRQAELQRIAEEEHLAELERQQRMRLQLAEDKTDLADAAMTEQHYATAMQLYEEAFSINPSDEAITEKLAEARAQYWLASNPTESQADAGVGNTGVRGERIARYEQAMARAARALNLGRYAEGHDAVVEARTLLTTARTIFRESERNELIVRAAQMQMKISETRALEEADRLAMVEQDRMQAESQSRAQIEQRRSEQVQQRLQNARRLQQNRDYAGALVELEAAQFIDPNNQTVEALRGIMQDVTLGMESVRLRRQLDLMRSNQQIVNEEATIPYDELLTYPGNWPELSELRLETDPDPNVRFAIELPFDAADGEVAQTDRIGFASPDHVLGQLRGELHRLQQLGDQAPPEEWQALRDRLEQLRLEHIARRLERPAIAPEQLNRDTYALVNDNPFYTGFNDPLSTFSVDVDTAAYALVRRQVMQQGQSPVPGAVRIEEMVNYFDYRYAAPLVEPELLEDGVVTRASLERLAAEDDSFAPFATHVEVADCPWADGHQLVRIGIKGMEVDQEDRPAAHLTFLLDVSGSMSSHNKLPLVVESMKMLLTQLNPDDHVSIVVYAGAAGVVLEHAAAADVAAIEDALNKLSAGGSTAGGAGIELAYNIAQRHFVDGGVNRVILCTDGDFNVGLSDRDALVELIKQRANPDPDDGQTRGVYLSVLGFGMGNLNDAMMEPLTNAGNGNYAYIDSAAEAHKVMVEQVGGTLVTIAKDVKIQVEFNPARVLAYRLIGYENRILAHEDFENDTVDAGDIGAGHTVTALYEVVPFPGDGLGDDERVLEVKRQIEALDAALAFSASVLENTPLTEEQYRKLMGSVTMMQQQRAVAAALAETVKRRPASAAVSEGPAGIDLRYRRGVEIVDDLDELMVVNLRYKPVDAPAEQGTSRLIQTVVAPEALAFAEASEDTRFAAAVAGYGMVLRHSPHRGDASFQWVLDTAGGALGDDAHGYRAGFVALVERSAQLRPADAEKERNVIAPR